VTGTRGRKVMVLFTDGEDSTSELSVPEIIQLVRSSSVTIYSVAFNAGALGSQRTVKSKAFLQHMADLSGGQIYSPTASRDLAGIYQKILDELEAQYVLGFTSDNPKADGKFRRLKVEVRPRGLRVRHRSGYYAPGR